MSRKRRQHPPRTWTHHERELLAMRFLIPQIETGRTYMQIMTTVQQADLPALLQLTTTEIQAKLETMLLTWQTSPPYVWQVLADDVFFLTNPLLNQP